MALSSIPPCRRARPRTLPTATTFIFPVTKPLRSMQANIRLLRAAIVSKARGCGCDAVSALRKSVHAAGARVMLQSSVRRLVVDNRTGAVLGAELWQFENESRAARRHRRLSRLAERIYYPAPGVSDMLRRRALAVELAEASSVDSPGARRSRAQHGRINFNREMVARYAPKYLRNFRLGTSGCDGSGIRLGQSVGGECAQLDRVSAWRFINPPLAWARGMIVDSNGVRFCNEEVYGAKLGNEMCERHGGKAWLVIDSKIRRDAIREALFGGLWGFQSVPALVLTYAGAKHSQLDRRSRAAARR